MYEWVVSLLEFVGRSTQFIAYMETSRDYWMKVLGSSFLVFFLFFGKEWVMLHINLGLVRMPTIFLARWAWLRDRLLHLPFVERIDAYKKRLIAYNSNMRKVRYWQYGFSVFLFVLSVFPVPYLQGIAVIAYVSAYAGETSVKGIFRHYGYWVLLLGSLAKELLVVYTDVFSFLNVLQV
jgi:hypothetical protein